LDTWRRVTSAVGWIVNDNVRVESSVLQSGSKGSGELEVVRKATRHLLRSFRLGSNNWREAVHIINIEFGTTNRNVAASCI